MNVALVVLDTLRKDAFDRQFDWLPGVQYENAWSTSHWTVPAHASLFTGRYASEVGAYMGAESLDCERPVLAEQLREAGYTTRAFSGNVNISHQFGYDRGFEQFEGSWRLRALEETVFDWEEFIVDSRDMGPKRYLLGLWRCLTGDCDTIPSLKHGVQMKMRDWGYGHETRDDGATAALDMIRNAEFGDREFLFVNLMEAHSPYDPPEEYQTVEPPEIKGLQASFADTDVDPERVRQAYRDSVSYLSDMYRKMFAELREDFDVIVTVSDHGELLGEYGAWEHVWGIPPELTHVPLSIYARDGVTDAENLTAGTREQSVSLLDVHRTILSLAGIDADDSRGRDLLEPVEDGEFLTEYHGLSDRYFQVLENNDITDYEHLNDELNGLVYGEYYGYEDFDGFSEIGDSPFKDPEVHLAERIAELDKRRVAEDDELDDAVMEQLEDLGYA
ncbi:sulfatase-like hydrolase/transferase [Halorussus limi]